MEKSFEPHAVEPRWVQRWSEVRVGIADAATDRPAFVIALPPPNITGVLHMGHAVMGSVQDILCRHHRMKGFEVEWAPGTDHAAIATQNVIEKQLAAEGTSKEELGREGFQVRVDAWYKEYGGRILEQMRALGFSLDWSRTRFTLDPDYVRAIRTAFKSLYDEGLIYRGPRIVNWCPRCRSAISDEEIDWQEHTDLMVQLRYPVEEGGSIVIATVRPETMLADTGVAVHPDDERYRDLIGKHVILPLVGRRIPIVADAGVERDFGTGALKVTPGHDPLDFEIAQRHGLPTLTVIGFDGSMIVPDLPQFDGLSVMEARAAVLQALRNTGVVVKEEEYVHEVGHCDRCDEVLEPLISEQWWVSMKPLAAPAIAANEQGRVTFHPRRFNDVYLSWMRNIRDWCISRQIWLGHAIPVSTCENGHRFAWVEEPTACEVCGDTTLSHDPDVLDTWFSSALWPFAIFGWPDDSEDLRRFYPTDVLGTAREIIFLWVARMVMTGLRFMDREPFHDVIINSTILAADGSRMSKSKGNAIDPLEMVAKYGADAVRAWAGAVGTSGQDMRFDEDRIASYQRFANKLWNVTRYLVTRLGEAGADAIAPVGDVDPADLAPEDRWILSRLAETIRGCDAAVAGYRFHDAMERLYDTTWHFFCDWYVEMSKSRLRDDADPRSRRAAAWTATTALDVLLRLLHPFMPFITEECAQRLPSAAATLQHRDWPSVPAPWEDAAFAADRTAVDEVLDLVQSLRAARQEAGVPAASRERHPLLLESNGALHAGEVRRLVESLAPFSVVDAAPAAMQPVRVVAGGAHATMFIGGNADDSARLRRQLDEVRGRIERLDAQLASSGFTERAPREVVERARTQLREAQGERERLRGLLGEVPA